MYLYAKSLKLHYFFLFIVLIFTNNGSLTKFTFLYLIHEFDFLSKSLWKTYKMFLHFTFVNFSDETIFRNTL